MQVKYLKSYEEFVKNKNPKLNPKMIFEYRQDIGYAYNLADLLSFIQHYGETVDSLIKTYEK